MSRAEGLLDRRIAARSPLGWEEEAMFLRQAEDVLKVRFSSGSRGFSRTRCRFVVKSPFACRWFTRRSDGKIKENASEAVFKEHFM